MRFRRRSTLDDRPQLDGAALHDWDLRRKADRLIEILTVEHEEPAQLLLRLGVRAVGDDRLPFPHTHRLGGGRLLELLSVDQMRPELLEERGPPRDLLI